jgi:hypothetical protein
MKFLANLGLAIKILTRPSDGVIELGGGVVFDRARRRLILPDDFELFVTGNLKLSAEQHLILKSGQGLDGSSPNGYAIWLNSPEDETGKLLDPIDRLECARTDERKHN